MKKRIPYPMPRLLRVAGTSPGSPLAGGEFEARAGEFLQGRLKAEAFLDICDRALDGADGETSEKTVYKYKFLALIALERYYEAMLIGNVMRSRYADELSHCQMLCAVSLKRRNYFKALEYNRRLVELARQSGQRGDSSEEEGEEIRRFLARVVSYPAVEFCRILARNPSDVRSTFAGVPLVLSGPATLTLDPDTGMPYFIFKVEDCAIGRVFCRCPKSEIPFIRQVRSGSQTRVFGYALSVFENNALMHPCCHIA